MNRAPDEKLVRRAQKGDKGAFAELFTRYEGPIYGYLYRMVGERTWAEDLAQEAFIQAHQHLGSLGPPYAFKAWVYRIARNLAMDGLRRHRYEIGLPDWDAGEVTGPQLADERRENDPQDQLRLQEVQAAVWQALHQLPDSYRDILILRELNGLSYKEIATVQDMSLNNVRVTLHRARERFRDQYGLQAMVKDGREACQTLDDLLSAYVDGELDRSTRRRVKKHIESCPECQEKRRELLSISRLLGVLAPVIPPATLRARFLKQLKELPPPKSSPTAGQPPSERGGGFLGGTPRAWLIAIAGGIGAATVIGLVAVGLLLLSRLEIVIAPSPSPSPSATPLPTATVAATLKSQPAAQPTASPTSTPTDTPAPPSPTPVPPSPTPVPATATFTPPPPQPEIVFWTDAETVTAGDCTTIHWRTANVRAVYFDGQGVAGTGEYRTCPCADETHRLDVTLPNGRQESREVALNVEGSCDRPTPDTQGPPAPAPLTPENGITLRCRSTVDLSWTAVNDPAGIARYAVQILNEQSKETRTWHTEETAMDVIVACGYGYRWHVRAIDELGNTGTWNRWSSFGVGID